MLVEVAGTRRSERLRDRVTMPFQWGRKPEQTGGKAYASAEILGSRSLLTFAVSLAIFSSQ